MSDLDPKNDNKYFVSFITILVLLLTGVCCVTAVYGADGSPAVSALFHADAEDSRATSSDPPTITDTTVNPVEQTEPPQTTEASPSIVFPLDGNITSAFALRIDPFYDPESGEEPTYEFHRGIDISAAKSSDILACADGIVSSTGYDTGYGKYIMIEHDGFVSLYAHCSDVLCGVGDGVAAGDSIAVAGSTGRSTGPHLHFEIRVGGVQVDPLEFVGCVFTGVIY